MARIITSPPGWTCDTQFAKNAIKEFTFDYAPLADANSGVVNDFRLTVVPNSKGVLGRNPMMTDNRGIVFVYYQWEMENTRATVEVLSSDREYSQIDALKEDIEQYANAKNAGIAPAKLDSAIIGSFGHEIPAIQDGGMRLVTRDFEAMYFPPTSTQNGFGLSVRCRGYAKNCLRSFFLDFGGVIHGTGEPRQATADDTPSPLCETGRTTCLDVDWSVP